MKISIDRIENNFAVCVAENLNNRELVFSLPVELFPAPPREGEIYTLTLTPDEAERSSRESEMKSKLNKLFNM